MSLFVIDPPGLPGHLRWLARKGIAILRRGRLQVEATLQLDEAHYRLTRKERD